MPATGHAQVRSDTGREQSAVPETQSFSRQPANSPARFSSRLW